MSVDWRDPLRMSVAALTAFAAAQALHLPEGFWAVLSALVVSRPHRGGTLQAGAGRLIGTLAGIGWAMLVAAGRHWQIAEILLLAAVLAPLALLIAWREEYRTAPVAAIIVLSSTPQDGAPVAAAALRLAEIALGAGIGIAVAWLLLPAGSMRRAEQHAAQLLDHLAGLLDDAAQSGGVAAERRLAQGRRLLQRLTVAARAAPWEGGDRRRADLLARGAARLHGDVAFLLRCDGALIDTLRLARCRDGMHTTAARLRDAAAADSRDHDTGDGPVAVAPPPHPVLAVLEQDIAAMLRLAAALAK